MQLSKTQLPKMIQLGKRPFLPLKFLLNMEKLMFDGIKKVKDLVKKCQMMILLK